jgi:hypothetical protein
VQVVDAPRQRSNAAAPRSTTVKQAPKTKPGPKRRSGRSGSASTPEESQDTAHIPPALLLLVRSLPPEGSPLPSWRRDQWVKMAEATLSFVYPEQAEDRSSSEIADVDGEE